LQLPVIFRLTPLCPPDLDEQLAGRGYRRSAPTLVLGLELAGWQAPAGQPTELQVLGLDPWLGVYDRVSASVAGRQALHAAILRAILPETLPAALTWQGQWAACGLGVLERGYFGLFDIVTQAGLRCQGLGTRLVGAMLAWAQDHGAQYSYLQVMEENLAARRLYERQGYAALYGYWYRVRD
ncbi:MAG: GNAT family N-acetyltransferase, partial [Anaerolineales bacterium]|nr:GNAT family N-acetyltransferase [Anaerolineales bacterium]